jgi:glucosamine-6-phosphate isomerase
MLVEDSRIGSVSFSDARFIGLDEWVGVPPETPGSCRGAMFSRLFKPLGIPFDRVMFFDSIAADQKSECRRMDSWLEAHGPVDLMVLGIGLNGHIGLNEPGSDPGAGCHVVELDHVTKQVMKKYFATKVQVSRGITIGMRQIMQSERVLLLASGQDKADIIAKVFVGEVTPELPASCVRSHKSSSLYVDRAAAAAIPKGAR